MRIARHVPNRPCDRIRLGVRADLDDGTGRMPHLGHQAKGLGMMTIGGFRWRHRSLERPGRMSRPAGSAGRACNAQLRDARSRHARWHGHVRERAMHRGSPGRLARRAESRPLPGRGHRERGRLRRAARAQRSQTTDLRAPRRAASDLWEAPRSSGALIRVSPLVRDLVRSRARGAAPHALARDFHSGLAARLAEAAYVASRATGLREIALSGGCLQNRLLRSDLRARLANFGLNVLIHRQIPPNDGGLAVGQAAVASTLCA